ncbi:hypothetical protein [Tenacibaculum sp. IB213877]|uniref:hypothetical protein n=1 Tax=Tenacibaculum sp. IB213877 TaxID=3097351 RepID=UPI002A5B02A9|nr:hypothetical protein [Tenacibaculum sp. IB213877]MDY0780787.1 hypothetical protein [Tenacibaculum sp. IB213877]
MEAVIVFLIGLTAVTIYDIVGSIMSRVLNFQYVWLTFGSFIIYGAIALYLQSYAGFLMAIAGSFIVGVYDSTIGLLISIKLKANIKEEDLYVVRIRPSLVLRMGLLASIIGFLSIELFS